MAKKDPVTGKQPESTLRKREKARNAAGLGPVKHPGVTREPAPKKPDGSPGPGAPHVVIDPDALWAVAITHASYQHMAAMLGCSDNTLKMNPEYEAIIQKARAERKKELLAAQFSAAIGDRNPTMLIWMGKQFLEQRDITRTEHTGADGKPIQTEKTKRVVAYFPDNRRRRPTGDAEGAARDAEGVRSRASA